MTNGRVEVITSVERRRRWSSAEKQQLVSASLEPGASVSAWRGQRAFNPASCMAGGGSWVSGRGSGLRRGGSRRRLRRPVRSIAGRDRIRHGRADADHRRGGRKRADGGGCGAGRRSAAMIPVASGVRVWIATGHTDMRRGMNTLALTVQEVLKRDPHGGDLYVFRGKNGKLIKILWHDGLGMSLYAKRLERGRFVWPQASDGAVTITSAQLGYLLEGIDWL